MNELEDRIRSAMHHRASTTRIPEVSRHDSVTSQPDVIRWADGSEQVFGRQDARPRGQRRRTFAVAAAVFVVAVGGLVSIDRWNNPSATSTVPSVQPFWDVDMDVIDPRAISLDTWIDTTMPVDVGNTYLVIDPSQIPDGLTIGRADAARYVLGDPDGDPGYRYAATITDGSRGQFIVTITKDLRGSCDETDGLEPVDMGGLEAMADDTTVCWELDGEHVVTVSMVDGPSPSPVDLLPFARALRLINVDQLPFADLTVRAEEPEPADVALAGTLRGVRWFVDVPPGTERTMSLHIAGNLSVGSDESYSDGEPVDAVELVTLDGVPGYGAVVVGFAPPATSHVIVTTAAGDVARIPVAQRVSASVFAVPIPDTVEVSALTFVAANGSEVATLEIPALPYGFGGSMSIGD